MNKKTFKALRYLYGWVDISLLHQGIYSTTVPKLYDEDTTIESLVRMAQFNRDKLGNDFVAQSYIENLRMCELVTVEITII